MIIITVSIVVNNVNNNKHPQAKHLTIPETGRCRKTKLIEVIVTYMYNSDDATMQTITIVNSHLLHLLECCCWFISPTPEGRAAPEGGGLINRNNTIKGVIKCLLPVARLRDAFATRARSK